jgi:hypothetical protein
MEIQQNAIDMLQEPIPQEEEKPIKLPDPNYTSPLFVSSKKANKKVASHLDFLKQLTNI